MIISTINVDNFILLDFFAKAQEIFLDKVREYLLVGIKALKSITMVEDSLSLLKSRINYVFDGSNYMSAIGVSDVRII